MAFAAYQSRDGREFNFEGRNLEAGILGTMLIDDAVPVATAETLEGLELLALAHLGKEPNDSLYLVDDKGFIYRTLINDKYHDALDKANRRTAIAVVLLVFAMTCLIFAALGFGGWALVSFVGVVGLYLLFLRIDMFNEIEAAVVCEILLILCLLLIPAIEAARSRTASRALTRMTKRGETVSLISRSKTIFIYETFRCRI